MAPTLCVKTRKLINYKKLCCEWKYQCHGRERKVKSFILLRTMRKNSQQLSWPWQINKSLPWRLEETDLSGIDNNMDIDELFWCLRKENWRCFIKGGKGHHLDRSLGPESCPHLSSVLGILHVPTPPPTTTSESFLMLLCSVLNLKYKLSRKYHQQSLFCP